MRSLEYLKGVKIIKCKENAGIIVNNKQIYSIIL